MRAAIVIALCAACRIPNEQFPVTDAPTGDAATDGTADGPTGCNLALPFDPPMPIAELDDAQLSELNPRLSHDELVIYYWIRAANTTTGGELVMASRTTPGGTFGAATNLTIDNPSLKRDPSVTGDNLTLYFASDEATPGTNKIYAATRATTAVDFANPAPVPALDTGNGDDAFEPYVMPNDQNMYLSIKVAGTGAYQLYASRRAVGGGAYTAPYQAPFQNLNVPGTDYSNPVVTVDLMTLYFESTRAGGVGGADIWKATRSSPGGLFGAPVNVTELNTTDYETPGWISDDGCRLYLSRSPLGVHDWKIYVASRPPM